MNESTVSVVVPTLHRPKHLEQALHSLLTQTRLPDEVIIVDQSDDSKTESLVSEEHPIFLSERVNLRYIREEIKGITHARNVGMHAAVGDIVFFLDDDMILDKHYISEMLKVYHENPNALGVQGTFSILESSYWKGISTRSILLNYIRKVFLLTHWEKDRQKILLSGDMLVAHPLTRIIEAEIIMPALSSFKREIVKDFCFDENLKGYSWGEEYFTLRLNLTYPHSLYVTPFAKAIHNHATVGRPTEKQFYYISTAYEIYNLSKHSSLSLSNWIAFVWKCIGRIVIALLGSHRKENRTKLSYVLQSYLWVLRNFGLVKKGEINLV